MAAEELWAPFRLSSFKVVALIEGEYNRKVVYYKIKKDNKSFSLKMIVDGVYQIGWVLPWHL